MPKIRNVFNSNRSSLVTDIFSFAVSFLWLGGGSMAYLYYRFIGTSVQYPNAGPGFTDGSFGLLGDTIAYLFLLLLLLVLVISSGRLINRFRNRHDD